MSQPEAPIFISTGLISAELNLNLINTVKEIIRLSSSQIQGIELCPNNENLSKEDIKALLSIKEAYGLQYRIHTPASWRPNSQSITDHVRLISESYHLASEIDALRVIQHPPITSDGELPDSLRLAYLKALCDQATKPTLLENGCIRWQKSWSPDSYSFEAEDAVDPYQMHKYIAGFIQERTATPFTGIVVDATKMARWLSPQFQEEIDCNQIEYFFQRASGNGQFSPLPIGEVHLVGIGNRSWDANHCNLVTLDQLEKYPRRSSLALTLESYTPYLPNLLRLARDYQPRLSDNDNIS